MNYKDFNESQIFFSNGDSFLPGISIDCVILGFHDGSLKILLNKFSLSDQWMLPGGFVFKEEDVDDAAYRILHSRTNLTNVYLQQFNLFGKKDRINSAENKKILTKIGVDTPEQLQDHWFLKRFISVGYYALVEHSKVVVHSNYNEETRWFGLDEVPEKLYSDHNTILESAIQKIRIELGSLPIGYELLPNKFTLTELRIIYESILRKKLDRRNFQRKILSTGFIKRLDEVSKKRGTKAATLYAFIEERYNDVKQNGLFHF